MMLLVAGCGYTEEEKAQIASLENQGKKNAVDYVQEKYGFTANVVRVLVEKFDRNVYPGEHISVACQYKRDGETKYNSARTKYRGAYGIATVYNEEEQTFALFTDND